MGKRRSVSAPLIITGLVAFLIFDLILVFVALRPSSEVATPEGSLSLPLQTPAPDQAVSAPPISVPSPGPTASEIPTAAPAPTSSAPALEGFADAQVGYRATAGSCDGPNSKIELTTDGGNTWTDVTPTEIVIHEVDSIVVVDSSHVDLLARYGDGCVLSDVSTYTQGEFWQAYPDRTAQLQG